MSDLVFEKRVEIVFHFNKMHLTNPTIPMWVIKVKGNTYYVNHLDVEKGVGFSTKETPDNEHTKGSIKLKGKLELKEIDNSNIVSARIY